jgi:ankyrin repeat protein
MLALENKVELLKYFLEIGADVEATDLEGRTALHISAWQGHFEIVSLLLKFGAQVNSVDNRKYFNNSTLFSNASI